MHIKKAASGSPKYTGIAQVLGFCAATRSVLFVTPAVAWQTISTIVKEEGFFALYYGNMANCVRIIPVYALKFTFNDTYKNLVKREGQQLKDLSFSQMIYSVFVLNGLQQASCKPR